MSIVSYILVAVLFFMIAALYASAGFGGGSSYLAVLVLLPVTYTTMRSTALLCNLVVVSGSLYAFISSKEFSMKLFKRMLPLVITSIPMAYLAGNFQVTQRFFFNLLGLSLVASSLAMFFASSRTVKVEDNQRKQNVAGDVAVGGLLGGLAGMVGIGGGIFLSPYLHLSRWETARKISITTAFFIFVNSLAGLLGHITNDTFDVDHRLLWLLAVAVFLGGRLGVTVNINRFSNTAIRRVTAAVILLAGINVLRKYWIA